MVAISVNKGGAMSQKSPRKQCKKVLKNGKRCKNAAVQSGYCKLHLEPGTGSGGGVEKLIAAGKWAPAITELIRLIEKALPYIHHVVHFRTPGGKTTDRSHAPATNPKQELLRIRRQLERMRAREDYYDLTRVAARTLKLLGGSLKA